MAEVNIYDQISSNKRKSYLLFFLFFVITFFLSFVMAEAFIDGNLTVSLIIMLFALVWSIFSYYTGDKIILTINHAKEASKKEHPYLINTVEGLSIAAGVPMPRVYIIEDDAPNAFATGRDPQHASITVTTGLLKKMNRLELEGVIAHEMSHIKNYDIRYMMLVVVMVGLIGILSNIIVRVLLRGGVRRKRGKGGGALIIIGLLFAIIAPIFAKFIQLAISREREYLADSSAALLTRYPKGLADALRKIAADQTPMTKANEDSAPLYIANPFREKKRRSIDIDNLTSTHPPIEDRIRILESM